jgi:hypothetical protein
VRSQPGLESYEIAGLPARPRARPRLAANAAGSVRDGGRRHQDEPAAGGRPPRPTDGRIRSLGSGHRRGARIAGDPPPRRRPRGPAQAAARASGWGPRPGRNGRRAAARAAAGRAGSRRDEAVVAAVLRAARDGIRGLDRHGRPRRRRWIVSAHVGVASASMSAATMGAFLEPAGARALRDAAPAPPGNLAIGRWYRDPGCRASRYSVAPCPRRSTGSSPRAAVRGSVAYGIHEAEQPAPRMTRSRWTRTTARSCSTSVGERDAWGAASARRRRALAGVQRMGASGGAVGVHFNERDRCSIGRQVRGGGAPAGAIARDGGWWDEIQMGILRDEWLAARPRPGAQRGEGG